MLQHKAPAQPAEMIPHSTEAEEAVIGSLLLAPEVIITIGPMLEPEYFFGEDRAAIYETIKELADERTPADLVTVRNRLKSKNLIGDKDGQVRVSYLLTLPQSTPTPYHATHYAGIVLQKAAARRGITQLTQAIAQLYNEGQDNPANILRDTATRLQATATGMGINQSYFLSHEEATDYPLMLERSHEAQRQTDRTGQMLRFGLSVFDGRDWTSPPCVCLLPSTLTTILARTGGGKTLAAMQIADTNAQARFNVLYFHVELNQEQMLARRYTRLTGIPVNTQLLPGLLTDQQRSKLLQASAQVDAWPGRVDFVHCPSWKMERLTSEVRAKHQALIASKGRGYDLVILDYVQRLARPDRRLSEHEAIAENVRAFSDCANELNIAALMTSQVSRAANEADQYRPPEVDEGLGSGDIERCSNQIIALAITEDETAMRYAVRKNTLGQRNLTGELGYRNTHFELCDLD